MIKPFKIADLVQNSFIKILFFSIIFVSTKWYISSLFYDENINFKIFLDAEYDDYYYYPYIKYLSELSFNLSFDQELDNLKFITIPFHTIIIHTIFFKVFGSWSIILLQILFFSLVVYFFYYYFYSLFCYISSQVLLDHLMNHLTQFSS